MVMVGYGHQGEEAVIYAHFKIICTMGVERRDKGSALCHNRFFFLDKPSAFVHAIEHIFLVSGNARFLSFYKICIDGLL